MSKVNANNMADAIMKELEHYVDVTEEDFENIAKEVAKEGRKTLKATSPRGKGSKKGHYADGWSVKYERKGNGKFRFITYNRKKPSLTHLLENGHALRQGGRTKAIPHIKPVEEWCNKEFVKRVEAKAGK